MEGGGGRQRTRNIINTTYEFRSSGAGLLFPKSISVWVLQGHANAKAEYDFKIRGGGA